MHCDPIRIAICSWIYYNPLCSFLWKNSQHPLQSLGDALAMDIKSFERENCVPNEVLWFWEIIWPVKISSYSFCKSPKSMLSICPQMSQGSTRNHIWSSRPKYPTFLFVDLPWKHAFRGLCPALTLISASERVTRFYPFWPNTRFLGVGRAQK